MVKKLNPILMVIAVAVMISCGANAQNKLILNKDGVGALKTNIEVSKIPAKCDGLYDRFEVKVEDDMGDEITYYYFYMGKDMTVKAEMYDNKLVNVVVYSSNVSTPDGIFPGGPVKSFLGRKDLNWQDYGDFAFLNKGYGYSLDGYSAAGSKKLENAYLKGVDPVLEAADFGANARVRAIGYVGQ